MNFRMKYILHSSEKFTFKLRNSYYKYQNDYSNSSNSPLNCLLNSLKWSKFEFDFDFACISSNLITGENDQDVIQGSSRNEYSVEFSVIIIAGYDKMKLL
ncbi:unnamed protein product [Heterobilharzia americana]|nr:unnamed protein product [Heterobilharzia americana]